MSVPKNIDGEHLGRGLDYEGRIGFVSVDLANNRRGGKDEQRDHNRR